MTDAVVDLALQYGEWLGKHDLLTLDGAIRLTPNGAQITREVTFEEYSVALQQCQILANASVWSLGDLLNYGEHTFGEKYSQSLDLTHKSYHTLVQTAYVSRQYPPEDRVTGVSWSHHREVVAMPNRDARRALLEEAAREGWNRDQIRERYRGDRAERPPATSTCPKCGHQW